jgi:hypothetical protein
MAAQIAHEWKIDGMIFVVADPLDYQLLRLVATLVDGTSGS